MSNLKKTFSILLTILLWPIFWITFSLLIIFLLIISTIFPGKDFNKTIKIICTILTYSVLLFPEVSYRKKGNLPYPVIYVANHVSFFDLFIAGSSLPGYPRGLEMQSHFSKPIYGWFISRFGQIPLDTDNMHNIKKTFKTALDILKNKTRNVFIMPEGSRTRTGKLADFKKGAFFLAKASGCPIVPVVVKNLYQHNNAKSLLIRPGKIKIIIAEPIFPADFDSEKKMAEFTWKKMNNILENKEDKKDETG